MEIGFFSTLVKNELEFNIRLSVLRHACNKVGELEIEVMKYVRATCPKGRHAKAGPFRVNDGMSGTVPVGGPEDVLDVATVAWSALV